MNTTSKGFVAKFDLGDVTTCTLIDIDAAPYLLTTANRELVLVTLERAPGSPPATIAVTGVAQDEPVTGKGDDTAPDAGWASRPDQVYVRAERNPQGDGRVYRIAYNAVDGVGHSCPGMVTVHVPREGSTAVDSAPPSYDSLGS